MRNPTFAFAFASTAAALLAAGLFTPRVARAQQQTFHLDRLEVPGAPDDGLVVFNPTMQEPVTVYGQLGFGLAVDPLRTGDITNSSIVAQNSASNVVTHQLSTYMSAGIELLDRLTAGLTLPIAWAEGGNQPQYQSAFVSTGAFTTFSINGPAVGDMRMDLRAVVLRSADRSMSLGGQLGVFFPTGTQTNFGGDGGVAWLPMVTGAWAPQHFVLPITFVANLGVDLRPHNTVNDPAGHNGPRQGLGIGDEIRWALGALMPIGERFRVGFSVFGQTGITDDGIVGNTFFTSQNTPVEWNAEGRMKLPLPWAEHFFVGAGLGTRLSDGYGGPDLRIVATAGSYWGIVDSEPAEGNQHKLRQTIHDSLKDTDGDGIPDDVDACPTVPEDHKDPDPGDGCPAPSDRDHDGIPDDVDKCPDQPEDKDGIDDQDGCPEDDADQDGIPDVKDACPKEPGQPDPDPKKNGCPKFIKLEGSSVRVLQQVHFQTASATILPDSFPMLGEIVALLKASPDIHHMRIEGHTDNRGGADYNLDLSKRRAASVRSWLVEHGIDAGRLESEGYGMTKPVASNDDDAGRAQNRRVEFKILEEGGAGSGGSP
jgi:outer membrane protein OmpA-like peptidoglycan-associated protein